MSNAATGPGSTQSADILIQTVDLVAPVLHCEEGLSFWGGVDPQSGEIIDAHHPQYGQSVAGKVLMMPTSRGSCTGSAVLLGLALAGNAPAALVFREAEDVLTLGAILANVMFDASIAVIRLGAPSYDRMAKAGEAALAQDKLSADGAEVCLRELDRSGLRLAPADEAMLAGARGPAAQLSMETICTVAALQGARSLIDVTRGHIDGCIYASPANLAFAEAMKEKGAQVLVPTTMNAISVDLPNWRAQGVGEDFGLPASRLAEAYVAMGATPSFTCAPYLLEDQPAAGETIGWSESNAVIYANSALGARTNKHPDFLDLMIAITGRAPLSGVYLEAQRRPALAIDVTLPDGADDTVWPMLGWLAGRLAPDRIPLLTGLASLRPGPDELKALCAAFGTTSGAPMLHIEGVTPEALDRFEGELERVMIGKAELEQAWRALNQGPDEVDLVALGSPHMSARECRAFAEWMSEEPVASGVSVIVTIGRSEKREIAEDGTLEWLERLGVTLVSDVCWCSISRPLFPANARNILTNSGKYAHYGPSLTGCTMRLGSLAECAVAAKSGTAAVEAPHWLS